MRHEPNFLQDQFRKDFYDFMHVSRKKINQKLAELVHVQVADALQNHYHIEVPELFKDNITHFASLLVKSKKLQGIFADFTD
jgi:negative regulator of sigma E activity